MTRAASAPHDRAGFRAAAGALLVVREPPAPPPPAPGQPPSVPANAAEGAEILVAVWNDGSVNALAGHVDLGTGVRTALAQLVAEELDVATDAVEMILGDTARAPNQGPTIASATIQLSSMPLRQAAAQARRWLVERAAAVLRAPTGDLEADEGFVAVRGDAARRVGYGELIGPGHVELMLDAAVALKPPAAWRVIGRPVPRFDIPAKATGEPSFVHDLRLPGMLHGRVVRPPYAGADHGEFIGNTLEAVDERSIAHIPGVVAVVVIRDFVGIVAEREEQAEAAMRELGVRWKDWPGLPPLADLAQALRNNPAAPRVVADIGDAAAANAAAPQRLQRRYVWPYQMHASIGPSCAVADWRGDRVTVWAGTQNPHVLRADLALLAGLPDVAVDVIRMEAAGCYGRNCADDVAADALLLSRAVGRPVRVQLTREQEHQWEPKGAAQWMEVDGALDGEGRLAAWDFATSYPSNAATTLALLLTGTVDPGPRAFAMGDRTSVPPYRVPNLRVTVNDMAPILRASWLRGVSALPNSFAHECFVDELAQAAGADPVEFRLRHLDDPRGAELLRATAERAGWKPRAAPRPPGTVAAGRGVAYARYIHSKFPGFGAAWSAWVADVEVNRISGEVHVRRVVVGHDAGTVVNPAGVQHQIHGNVVQTTSRALAEQVHVEPRRGGVADREWGSYPILSFREVPVIEVLMMPRQGEPPLGAGESSSVPGTAAIANAIFDATGVRLREPPFTPEVVRAALGVLPGPADEPSPQAAAVPRADDGYAAPRAQPPVLPSGAHWPRGKSPWARAGALAAGLLTLGAAALGWRPSIAPAARPDASIYTAATIERGRRLAALGDCVGCHTAPGGQPNAGGRVLETPFGSIVTTNITPDVDTGIGAWSFSAFQRAMREGIARDGRHLYPAFPYPAFTRVADDELMALYAYLMSLPAVRNQAAPSALAFPFNLRPLMAMWNALYLVRGEKVTEPSRSELWNRGELLVNGLGHCGSCHTPRDAFGAERTGPAYLAGALVEGWEAPPLTALNRAPVPWTEQELFRYLRSGYSEHHGVAAGTMATVVANLAPVPDEDLRAMAHYLGSFQAGAAVAVEPRSLIEAASARAPLPGASERLFRGACGACHGDGNTPVELGMNLPLALNTNLASERPHNVIRIILDGIQQPPSREVGFMPGYRDSLDDRQIAELAAFLRRRFAPHAPPWSGIEATVAELRALPRHAGR